MSDSVRPHRWQSTRLSHPWDSPGKNTGMGCYFLLKCMKVKSESEAAPLCPTPSDPRDCSLPGSSVHGIFQARVMEWVAISLHSPLVLNFFRPVVLSLFVGCCIYKECAICVRQVIFFSNPEPSVLAANQHYSFRAIRCQRG